MDTGGILLYIIVLYQLSVILMINIIINYQTIPNTIKLHCDDMMSSHIIIVVKIKCFDSYSGKF